MAHSRSFCILIAFLLVVASALPACNQKPRRRARAVQPDVVLRDVPPVLSGTVGAQASIRGGEGLLVSGYGLVVDLAGTGDREIPGPVRAFMEREMSLQGVGQALFGMDDVSPGELLDSERTAVVLVQGVVPPGAVTGQRFDISVRTVPGSSATSLEGGRLWTTDLREGVAVPGGPQTQVIATAHGDLFINPFADPAKQDEDAIVRTEARILNGGAVVTARDLVLSLDNPSHARARSIVSAINAKWPHGDGRADTARGVNDETLLVNVPREYADNSNEFIRLLRGLRIDQGFGRMWAQRYAQAIRAEPYLAEELSWAMQSLGKIAIPPLRDLYDFPEPAPRLAALRAGAAMGDALATPHLKEIARSGNSSLRLDAIKLLGDMGVDPRINTMLRELLSDPAADVRVSAYEALANRGDPLLTRRYVEDKFVLDIVPSAQPTIYITQQRQPRIVVFGEDLEINRPILATGWDERLMVAADAPDARLRVYYRDHASDEATSIADLSPETPSLILTLAHEPTPENPRPGFALTYSEVVGALHELWQADALSAEFIAEQDILAAELLRSLRPVTGGDRPETGLEADDVDNPTIESFFPSRPRETGERQETKKTYVAPIPRNLQKDDGRDGG